LTPSDRAALFKAIEAERTPQRKTRQIRAFLDSARRAQVYWPALIVMAEALRTLEPAPEIGWFAETAVEIALVSGDHERARAWVAAAAQANAPQGNLDHWLALIDIAAATDGSGRAAHLDSVERLALTGRFDSVLLHRLATVLDALGTYIPVPLWEAASRTPQPAGGHLPGTGVLTALLEASKRKEFGHTVLLAMQALGPAGAEGAHLIALGDSIRALKRAGLEAEARSLSLEALFAGWPRAGA
jgi:acetyl-CoA acetyltransferase